MAKPTTADKDSSGAYGHTARKPSEIPGRGWKQIAKRVFINFGAHNMSLLAAGVAMFGLLAAFPALNVGVTIYALFSSPEQITSHLEPVQELLPEEAFDIIENQLRQLAGTQDAALNLALFGSILFGLWSARKGANALVVACNVVYGEKETRPLWKKILLTWIFTAAGIIGLVVLSLSAILLPVVLDLMPLGDLLTAVVNWLRWPLLAAIFVMALQAVYRFAPDREDPQWRWVSWGAIVATGLWLLASILFSTYVQNFGRYNETYGAIGGVIILMLWFNITALAILLGAEINAEMEHQTEVDSTTGERRPMGQRGAYVADTTVRENQENESDNA